MASNCSVGTAAGTLDHVVDDGALGVDEPDLLCPLQVVIQPRLKVGLHYRGALAGANIKAVQTLLGHATAVMTLDRYGHLLSDDLDQVMGALDKAAQATAVA
jgi:hypothetical protein